MEFTQLQMLGLDEQAKSDLLAEQAYHQQRLSEIAKQTAGTWAWVLADETERHTKLLTQIFIEARKRSGGFRS